MIETMIALLLLFLGIVHEEAMIILASSFYAIAVNIGNLAKAVENK